MGLSRRIFLRDAAYLPLAIAVTRAGHADCLRTDPGRRCLILNSSCVLKESLEGYKASLSAAGMVCGAGSSGDCPFIAAPAASLLNFNEVRWLSRRAETGACVLVESGGIFLSGAEFRRHRFVAQSQFGLTLLPPVKLWQSSDIGIPYVDFTWPVPARVRDFSRAIPLSAETVPDRRGAPWRSPREAISVARIGGKVVALKCRLGAGTLVFLGSPLGPHLLAGDREAQRWFAALSSYGLD